MCNSYQSYTPAIQPPELNPITAFRLPSTLALPRRRHGHTNHIPFTRLSTAPPPICTTLASNLKMLTPKTQQEVPTYNLIQTHSRFSPVTSLRWPRHHRHQSATQAPTTIDLNKIITQAGIYNTHTYIHI